MFPYGIHGSIQDDFGNIIPLSNSSWECRWHFWYDTGFYHNY